MLRNFLCTEEVFVMMQEGFMTKGTPNACQPRESQTVWDRSESFRISNSIRLAKYTC